MKIDKSILLFSKDDEWCLKVKLYLQEHFKTVIWFRGNWGDSLPSPLGDMINPNRYKYDYIISYLCPWILPKWILDMAKEHAINFHPAPPKYPGIGGYNYAIWNGDETYGVMCHEMSEKVDSGQIYNIIRFSIDDDITVKSLKDISMQWLYTLFQDIIDDIINDGRVYQTVDDEDTKWHTPPYTRVDFQKACEIKIEFRNNILNEMVNRQIKRHVKAFYFPGARDYPYFLINGKKYKVTPVEKEKL